MPAYGNFGTVSNFFFPFTLSTLFCSQNCWGLVCFLFLLLSYESLDFLCLLWGSGSSATLK